MSLAAVEHLGFHAIAHVTIGSSGRITNINSVYFCVCTCFLKLQCVEVSGPLNMTVSKQRVLELSWNEATASD